MSDTQVFQFFQPARWYTTLSLSHAHTHARMHWFSPFSFPLPRTWNCVCVHLCECACACACECECGRARGGKERGGNTRGYWKLFPLMWNWFFERMQLTHIHTLIFCWRKFMTGCQRNEQAVKVERALLGPTQVVKQRLWCKTSWVHIYPLPTFFHLWQLLRNVWSWNISLIVWSTINIRNVERSKRYTTRKWAEPNVWFTLALFLW